MLRLLKQCTPRQVKTVLRKVINAVKLPLYYLKKSKDMSLPKKYIGEDNTHCFFGYYDITPFNIDDSLILAMHAKVSLKTPTANDFIHVGYYRLDDSNPVFNKVGTTNTWCWQQGCRLRWFPIDCNNIIYNTMVNNSYGSVVKNIFTGKKLLEFPYSFYDIDNKAKYGYTLNFSRLQRLRPGYGYSVLKDETKNGFCPDDDGVWKVDLHSGEANLMFSLHYLSQIDPHESMLTAEHYINHISINPGGNAFLFLHLWVNRDTGKRYSRLFTASEDGSSLTLVDNTGSTSHYTWFSDDLLLVFTKADNGLKRYCMIHIENGFQKIIGEKTLLEDGHPSFVNEELLITDTYPNVHGDQTIILYSIEQDKKNMIGRFNMPLSFSGEFRCDLHPRLSESGKYVAIDIVLKGHRAMCVIDVQEVL